MSTNRTLRTLPAVLACVAGLALGAPAAAGPPAGNSLWQWLAGLSGLSFLVGEEGAGADPFGGWAAFSGGDLGEAGAMQDPNGAAAPAGGDHGEVGAGADPNG